jgi:hypothetical protein
LFSIGYFLVIWLQGTTGVSTGLGVTGLAVTGGSFYNHLSNPDGSLALANEGTTLDSCLGHSDQVSFCTCYVLVI